MIVGYARVSTEDQNLALQVDALRIAGCVQIFEDHGVSAKLRDRPAFTKALDTLQAGDMFVVWKMDRAFRSLRHALDVLEDLENRRVEFKVLTEGIDTSTAMGKCFYQIRNAFAELERNLISERTKAGIAAARARGVQVGRPKKLTESQIARARLKMSGDGVTKKLVASELGVHEATLARALRREID